MAGVEENTIAARAAVTRKTTARRTTEKPMTIIMSEDWL
jgi:hypothetical protein